MVPFTGRCPKQAKAGRFEKKFVYFSRVSCRFRTLSRSRHISRHKPCGVGQAVVLHLTVPVGSHVRNEPKWVLKRPEQ